ncbi:MAG: amidinotransferase [Bacteroidetes bacterium]|nr:amidinotransferase [Bacteroidota bacterium]
MLNSTSKILMIRPVNFGFNQQTAESNSFQQRADMDAPESIQKKALEEFDAFANKLIAAGIEVVIFDDTTDVHTPDSIFPNNWISFHENNELVLYPMLAENRRLERREDIISGFKKKNSTVIDLSKFESKKMYLEGTGSIVFDYDYKIAYANSSPRTNKMLFEQLCKQLNFESIYFKAVDKNGNDILLYNFKGERYIVMSEQAYKSLTFEQIKKLEQYGNLLHSPLYTIEKYGGGSARCMIAEIK